MLLPRMPEAIPSVKTTLGYMPREALDALPEGPLVFDMRVPSGSGGAGSALVPSEIHDARAAASELGLEKSGFELFERPSAVRDWFDEREVIATYYAECKALARELTGATHAFTYDHLIREPGKQTSGGGLGKRGSVTGPESGGGYIHSVHMDYTDSSEWSEYLALHGVEEPANASRVVVFNFWRPIANAVEDNPLAVCDARSVRDDDLAESVIYGYGPKSYSWHDIGISIYNVAPSPEHTWYYYPRMTPDEVLVIKSYDSDGVIGRSCPHTSFHNPSAAAGAPARRSIELRVLCYIGAS
jgi:hypothetical protein